MIEAELNGKIPSILQNYEDILTSSVIGTFQYLSCPRYIQSILESSLNLLGVKLRFDFPIVDCHYVFWPRLENSEPDVLMHLKDEVENEYLICIEAKYLSDKSSTEDERIKVEDRNSTQRDQLAREIEDLYKEKCYKLFKINKKKLQSIKLIYLTNHSCLPLQDILDSVQHVREIPYPKEQLYWLSWRNIHQKLCNIKEYNTLQDKKLLEDLVKILIKKGLHGFGGFKHGIEFIGQIDLIYEREMKKYLWNTLNKVNIVSWDYGGN